MSTPTCSINAVPTFPLIVKGPARSPLVGTNPEAGVTLSSGSGGPGLGMTVL